MATPDFSRGGGFGTPELKADLVEEHHEEAAREIKADREAKHAIEATQETAPHVPWYRRLLRRP